jgi:hypothetical protein
LRKRTTLARILEDEDFTDADEILTLDDEDALEVNVNLPVDEALEVLEDQMQYELGPELALFELTPFKTYKELNRRSKFSTKSAGGRLGY